MASQALDSVVSHWSTLIENFSASPLAFYEALDGALKTREVPETKSSRVEHKEAGLLSANREYLRITREKLVVDVCAAPFGTGFFVSWWLVDERPQLNPLMRVLALIGLLVVLLWAIYQFGLIFGPIVMMMLVLGGLAGADAMAANGDFDANLIRSVPIVGSLYAWLFKPATFYRIDTMEMFQRAVHNAVLEVIDTMTAEKGIRALSESNRKPVMREFYARKGA